MHDMYATGIHVALNVMTALDTNLVFMKFLA